MQSRRIRVEWQPNFIEDWQSQTTNTMEEIKKKVILGKQLL